MSTTSQRSDLQRCEDGIPLPIVKLNRWSIVTIILIGVLLQQPLWTTGLFVVLLPASVFGRRASLIYFIGRKVFASQIRTAPLEDQKLQRFNNSIATLLLGAAQLAFLFQASLVGWILSLAVLAAASVALAGFCVGCFLFYQFNLQRFRWGV